jgi:hypothetical protein
MTRATLIRLGLIAGVAAAVAGCSDGYYNNGYYGGGIANPYYAGPVGYGAEYYGGIGYPAYGVYNDFYYPGSGIYVFDRDGRRREWNEDERRHWEYRGNNFHGSHLMENGHYVAQRDRAYHADRAAGYQSFRQGGGQGGHPQGGHHDGDRHR